MSGEADSPVSVTVEFAPSLHAQIEELAKLHTNGDVGRFMVLLAVREVNPSEFAALMANEQRVA